jgi:MYXO-CTERM domain-containing protein
VAYSITDGDGEVASGTLTFTVNSQTVTTGGPQLPGGSALDPLTLALLGLGAPALLRRRRR